MVHIKKLRYYVKSITWGSDRFSRACITEFSCRCDWNERKYKIIRNYYVRDRGKEWSYCALQDKHTSCKNYANIGKHIINSSLPFWDFFPMEDLFSVI